MSILDLPQCRRRNRIPANNRCMSMNHYKLLLEYLYFSDKCDNPVNTGNFTNSKLFQSCT